MLYYYIWNSEYLLKEEVKAWKKKFLLKFWDFNLIELNDIENYDNNFLSENITAWSFLSEKKFILISLEEVKDEEKNNFFINLLDKIPENNIVLIYQINPDKRSKLYKKLHEISQVKEFNIKDEYDVSNIIQKKFNSKISLQAINIIIKYKAWNINKIISEIEKLLITKDYIDQNDIIQNITPELEESIFQIIDSLLNLNKNDAIEKIDTILYHTNIYAFYNNLLANLRTNIYIYTLKNQWLNSEQIINKLQLWNRWFLVTKNYKINFKQLKNFYIWLINIDKKMKTGKLIWTEENDFRLELENKIIMI
jgi:DNA polymerase III delta subunit